MALQVIKDLIGGNKPEPIDIHYNGTIDVDSVTKRYAGSWVKLMDIDNVDNGWYYTWGGGTTAMENTVGILAEEQGITGNYLPDSTTYGMTIRKMYPVFPSTVIRGEYEQFDAAGTATHDDSATASAGSTTFTVTITTADYMIGGWIYMLSGDAAGELHYIKDNGTTTATMATAFTNAVVAADKYLVIRPSCANHVLWDATYSGLKSEIADGSCTKHIMGLMTYIQAPGIPFQPLSRDKHDGLIVSGAKFYHDFLFCGATDAASTLVALLCVRGQAAA